MSTNEFRTSFFPVSLQQMTFTFWFFIPSSPFLNTNGPSGGVAQTGQLQLILLQSDRDTWRLLVYQNHLNFLLSVDAFHIISEIDFNLRALDDSWNHFAVSLTPTSCRIYVNGVLVDDVMRPFMDEKLPRLFSEATKWRVSLGDGDYYYTNEWSPKWKQSLIDDFRLYSRTLTALEIATSALLTLPVTTTTPVPGRRLLANYFGPDDEETPASPAAPPTSTRALPVTTTPDPRVVDYFERRVTVTCSCPRGSALCARCTALQDARFAVGASEFVGSGGSAAIVAGYVNFAGVARVCADGEEFRTDWLTRSIVCVEKSASSSNVWIIVAVLLVFVLLLAAFAARFRHRIYVFVMPQAAQPDVISFKGADTPAAEPLQPPLAVPVLGTGANAHLLYALKFNK